MKPTLYKIYYNKQKPFLAYIGRTKNDLTQRLRHHFYGHVLQKKLDIAQVSHIEYAEFATTADMFVTEIVLINQHKPPLNVDDKAQDELTLNIDLAGVEWQPWNKPHLIEKWKNQY